MSAIHVACRAIVAKLPMWLVSTRGTRDYPIHEDVANFCVYKQISSLSLLAAMHRYHPQRSQSSTVYCTNILNSIGELMHTRRLTPHQTKKAMRVIQITIDEMSHERH